MPNVFKRRILANLAGLPGSPVVVIVKGRRHAEWRDPTKGRRRAPICKGRSGEEKVQLGQSSAYYGKIKIAPGRWERVPLFTDKQASERQLQDLQKAADRRAAGVTTADTERLALPIAELCELYHAHLRQLRRDDRHIRISEGMINRLIKMGGWKRFNDISVDSLNRILERLEADSKTTSYQNKFIKRAKAFVHWLLPKGCQDPLEKLKQISEKNARRRRGRRPATVEQQLALLILELPCDRELSYALAMLNGLRRNEVAKLRWSAVVLGAPIPFLKLKKKNDEKGVWDYIPLHPYVVDLMKRRTTDTPDAKVVRAVPDVETLKKDWERAAVAFIDGEGLRLDFHALRHTFTSTLDHTGCSRATKKRLTRHANEDVTDGYAHAELAEMLTAITRIPSPSTMPANVVLRTGTDGAPVVEISPARTKNGTKASSQGGGPIVTQGMGEARLTPDTTNESVVAGRDEADCLPEIANADIVRNSRPDTQVGYRTTKNSPEKQQGSPPEDQGQDQDTRTAAALREIAATWPSLPSHTRYRILRMLRASSPSSPDHVS